MKFLPIHTDALRSFGYTEEEARFLYLVATHSGYFTCQQFLHFMQTKPGKRSVAFAQKVIEKNTRRRSRISGMAAYFTFSRAICMKPSAGKMSASGGSIQLNTSECGSSPWILFSEIRT
jgi:hypothetical protein